MTEPNLLIKNIDMIIGNLYNWHKNNFSGLFMGLNDYNRNGHNDFDLKQKGFSRLYASFNYPYLVPENLDVKKYRQLSSEFSYFAEIVAKHMNPKVSLELMSSDDFFNGIRGDLLKKGLMIFYVSEELEQKLKEKTSILGPGDSKRYIKEIRDFIPNKILMDCYN